MSQFAIETSTIKPQPDTCGWCLESEATHQLFTVPTCDDCGQATAKARVRRWMRAVHARNYGGMR